MTEQGADKINPLTITDSAIAESDAKLPIGFAVICNESGAPVLHEIPDHRTPTNKELFNISWFLTGSIIGGTLEESE